MILHFSLTCCLCFMLVQQAVVVGGGYIGMEVAAQLINNGISATIVCPEDRLLARLFTPKATD
jgi:NADPH-dependent 2,4-dienoyl-CoA reductase/sulfur reductase-like enzyme